MKTRERNVPFHFRPPGSRPVQPVDTPSISLGQAAFNLLSFWVNPELKACALSSLLASLTLDHCVDQTGSKRRSEQLSSGICCQLPPACCAANRTDSRGSHLETSRLGQRLESRLATRLRLSKCCGELVALVDLVCGCVKLCLGELRFSRQARRVLASGLQRLLVVIRVFFFLLASLAFPPFLTTYTQDTFCLFPSLFGLASDPEQVRVAPFLRSVPDFVW